MITKHDRGPHSSARRTCVEKEETVAYVARVYVDKEKRGCRGFGTGK